MRWPFFIFPVFAVVGFAFRKQINTVFLDINTRLKIGTLHPQLRPIATAFIKEARSQGINVFVTEGIRDFTRQDKLYQIGRDASGQVIGGIVTNARAGQSYHNYGLALDVVIINDDGSANYDVNNPEWYRLGQIGKSFGFVWGGDFKSIVDMPHFEMNFGLHHTQLLDRYSSGNIINGYVNLS